MGKDNGRDRSQDRRLLECKACGQRFYSYRITKEAECPNCETPTAREVRDHNIEDGDLPQAGRFSKKAGSGKGGCLAPLVVFVIVLAVGFGLYHFRNEIANQLRPANAPHNEPADEPSGAMEAPEDTPVESDTPTETAE